MMPLRVLVVEDSAPTRGLLANLLRSSKEFELVGAVASAQEAVAATARLSPALVLLDLFVPGGSASAIIRSILAIAPIPIVLLSSADRSCDEAFDALAAGAVDFITKPNLSRPEETKELKARILSLRHMRPRLPGSLEAKPSEKANHVLGVVVIGSSTGGPVVLCDLLTRLPKNLGAPVLVAQHISEGFESGMVRWLRGRTGHDVRLAAPNGRLVNHEVIVGVSGLDLAVEHDGYVLERCPQRGFHPSCDRLFESAARAYSKRVLAVVLSGIGNDGTSGARAVVAAGGTVYAQDELTSISFGMPGSALKEGLAALSGSSAVLSQAIVDRVSYWWRTG